MKTHRFLTVLVTVIAISGITPAGQNYDRRFARISYLEGNLVFRHDSESEWVSATVNTPLQEQDRVYVPINSKGEIEFDDGSFLRMAEDTEVRILRLDNTIIQVELSVGLTTVRYSSRVSFQIETPSGAVRLIEKGVFRIEVPRNGSLDVAVQRGSAEVLRGREVIRLRRREAVAVPADQAAAIQHRPIDREDGWDAWNDRRDATILAASSSRYLPADVYLGAYELDSYGTWVDVSGYGYCWRPLHVNYGWSPYRYGRWIHRPFWGWTWVSYESWGWLPYHYGRWFRHPVHDWCWWPDSGFGLSVSFRFWSPGLVNFYHHGGGYHWVPLHPWDYHSPHNYYYNATNITYNTYIRNYENNYAQHRGRGRQPNNLNAEGAVVSLAERSFISGGPGERIQVRGRELASIAPLGSSRELTAQPAAASRSPRPEMDVRTLGVVDTRRSVGPRNDRETTIQPTVQTVLPGGNGQASRVLGFDTRRTNGELVKPNLPAGAFPLSVTRSDSGRRIISNEWKRPSGSSDNSDIQAVPAPAGRTLNSGSALQQNPAATAQPVPAPAGRTWSSGPARRENQAGTSQPELSVSPRGTNRETDPSRSIGRRTIPDGTWNLGDWRNPVRVEPANPQPLPGASPRVEPSGRRVIPPGSSPSGTAAPGDIRPPDVQVIRPERRSYGGGSSPTWQQSEPRGGSPNVERVPAHRAPMERDRSTIQRQAPPPSSPGPIQAAPTQRTPPRRPKDPPEN